MIIDCHGHYTTAPKGLEAFRQQQIAALKDPARNPSRASLAIPDDQLRESLENAQLKNVYFDTCVYRQPGIDLLLKVVPADNILFASEMVGAVRGMDPETAFTTTTRSATSMARRD